MPLYASVRYVQIIPWCCKMFWARFIASEPCQCKVTAVGNVHQCSDIVVALLEREFRGIFSAHICPLSVRQHINGTLWNASEVYHLNHQEYLP